MKILLLGKNGQVGWALQRSLAALGSCQAFGRDQADLTQPNQLRQLIRQLQPTVIVNAAAYTAVDQAETATDLAYQINTAAVEVLALEAKALNAWLVSYSTDYVFDGTQAGAYDETDVANPLNVYGDSKWQGEEAIRASGCQHLLVRTSWVYGLYGDNFAKTILRLAQQRQQLSVIDDQIGTPTSADCIADVTALMLYRIHHDNTFAQQASGTYHLTAAGQTSWYHYAQFVLQQALAQGQTLQLISAQLQPIATSGYPLPAQRPANSCLNSDKLKRFFGIELPHWQHHLIRLIRTLLQPGH
ncbi:dTDP-4-dehydrorhamnose reductase [unidentified bacterial endosymbiont]|uniref:dTDP-4-dehydrorhamnose reductase n=1 Tax=unidentified bacterial endosymbiont TaxID=2355 RepID=UPI00209D450C|nr:dTDP-4-dehydrorhamnose reductase [unidentified bacterial endosymbiont]